MHAARLPVALDLTSLNGKAITALMWEESQRRIIEGTKINKRKGLVIKASLSRVD
jgi:hypothetical protein